MDGNIGRAATKPDKVNIEQLWLKRRYFPYLLADLISIQHTIAVKPRWLVLDIFLSNSVVFLPQILA